MNKKVKPVLSNYFRLPNPGLRNFLRTNVEGSIKHIRTPLFDGRPRDEIVEEWESIFSDESAKLTESQYVTTEIKNWQSIRSISSI